MGRKAVLGLVMVGIVVALAGAANAAGPQEASGPQASASIAASEEPAPSAEMSALVNYHDCQPLNQDAVGDRVDAPEFGADGYQCSGYFVNEDGVCYVSWKDDDTDDDYEDENAEVYEKRCVGA